MSLENLKLAPNEKLFQGILKPKLPPCSTSGKAVIPVFIVVLFRDANPVLKPTLIFFVGFQRRLRFDVRVNTSAPTSIETSFQSAGKILASPVALTMSKPNPNAKFRVSPKPPWNLKYPPSCPETSTSDFVSCPKT